MNEERSQQQQPTTMTRCDTPAAAMIPCSVSAYDTQATIPAIDCHQAFISLHQRILFV